MTFTNQETLDLIIKNKVKEDVSWLNMATILANITMFGKIDVQEQPKKFGLVSTETDDSVTIDYLMAIFDKFDEQYHLIEMLDELIDFKKIFGSLLGGLVEKVDHSLVRGIVKYVIFPLILSFFGRKKISLDTGLKK